MWRSVLGTGTSQFVKTCCEDMARRVHDDLMRGRFDAKHVEWTGGVDVGNLENGGVGDEGELVSPFETLPPRPQLP